MICSWCKGLNKECGCGLGYCAHCDNGKTADPPFGPAMDSEELQILTSQDFDVIIDGQRRDVHAQIDYVSIHLTGKQLLTKQQLRQLKTYWDDLYREETLGDVLNRAAWMVHQCNLEYSDKMKG